MEVKELSLPGLMLIKPKAFQDARGFFLESYNQNTYNANGIDTLFVQDNHSFSKRGTIRGMHFQSTPGQAKLIRVAHGEIFDVAVDIRPESKTFGRWLGVYLNGEEHHQLYIPIGFAHGFCVTSPEAHVMYKTSSVYNGATEIGFQWNDPHVGIQWPIEQPIISERDQKAPSFQELDFSRYAK